MKTEWHTYSGRNALIVFCNGWGMDVNPFRPLSCNGYDVLICHDYSEEAKEASIERLAGCYREIHLVSWSMGVVHAQKFFGKASALLTSATAINGTLQPVHDSFGIPVDICRATYTALDEDSLVKFYKRMCRSDEVLKRFLEYRPARSVRNQREELGVILENGTALPKEESIYTSIIISTQDLVIPSVNQSRFWQGSNVISVPGGHFPFYNWNSWDELMEVAVEGGRRSGANEETSQCG